MRVDTDRAVDILRALGNRTNTREPRHTRPDRQKVAHALAARGIEHAVKLGGEVGKIEVAVAIDKHGPNLSDWAPEFKRSKRARSPGSADRQARRNYRLARLHVYF